VLIPELPLMLEVISVAVIPYNIICVILLTGCTTVQHELGFSIEFDIPFIGSTDITAVDPVNVPEELQAKSDLYCSLSWPEYYRRGYVHSRCDGVLFTSLYGIGCPDVSIDKFEGEPGQWFRSPKHNCLKNGSGTTISRDMLLGIMHYGWYHQDERLLKDLKDYGSANLWIMGESDGKLDNITTPILSPQLAGLLLVMTGSESVLATASTDHINDGFRSHLDVLRILLKGSVLGSISVLDLKVLKAQAKRSPNNALYQAALALYTDGDMTRASALLMDPKHFPGDSLPTSKNHCTEYLYQRDEGTHSWKPCDAKKIHSGTDLIFAASVIMGNVR
jgi:hypothetical protein